MSFPPKGVLCGEAGKDLCSHLIQIIDRWGRNEESWKIIKQQILSSGDGWNLVVPSKSGLSLRYSKLQESGLHNQQGEVVVEAFPFSSSALPRERVCVIVRLAKTCVTLIIAQEYTVSDDNRLSLPSHLTQLGRALLCLYLDHCGTRRWLLDKFSLGIQTWCIKYVIHLFPIEYKSDKHKVIELHCAFTRFVMTLAVVLL